MNIAHETPVGVIVAERLGRAHVFERLGIDYCCHGATTLAEACAERSLDVDRVMAEIAESDLREANEDFDRIDGSAMTAGGLADHIVGTHHAFLRRELPSLCDLMDKVAAAHGATHPELANLSSTLTDLRQELDPGHGARARNGRFGPGTDTSTHWQLPGPRRRLCVVQGPLRRPRASRVRPAPSYPQGEQHPLPPGGRVRVCTASGPIRGRESDR